MMNHLLIALQFLTRIPLPVKGQGEAELPKSLAYFPLAGAIIGLIAAGLAWLLTAYTHLTHLAISTASIVALAALTGGLHLDGLADTCDALLCGKDREGMLEVMRDSHTGVMGVVGLLSSMALKITFLASLPAARCGATLILICTISRWSQVAGIFCFPYARSQGKARIFSTGITPASLIGATAIAVLLSAVTARFTGIIILACAAIATILAGRHFQKIIGGITGDTLGATSEMIEILTLLLLSLNLF